MIKRIGSRTIGFENRPAILGYASVAGKKESEGALSKYFDKIIYDEYNGKETFEEAESSLQAEALRLALEKSRHHAGELNAVFAGDLLNQCTGSGFGMKDY